MRTEIRLRVLAFYRFKQGDEAAMHRITPRSNDLKKKGERVDVAR